jgi:hypothetical protein
MNLLIQRSQALQAGLLVDLTLHAPQLCAEHFQIPVAATRDVWALVQRAIQNPREMNDLQGVLHDIFTMARLAARGVEDPKVHFSVIITGTGPVHRHQLKLILAQASDLNYYYTVMLAGESEDGNGI